MQQKRQLKMEGEKNDEAQQQEEQTEETHKEDVGKRNPLEEAKEVLSALEKQNEVMKENLARAEELAATNLVSGGGLAGQISKKETKDEKIEREAKEIIASIGMEL